MDADRIKRLPVAFSLEGHTGPVTCALHTELDVFVTASMDYTVRFWRKRKSGKHLPTLTTLLESHVTAMAFDTDHKTLYLACVSGAVKQYQVAEDYSTLTHMADMQGHQGRVTGLALSANGQWLLSGGHDRQILVHDTQSASQMTSCRVQTAVACMTYDDATQHVFVGGSNGAIFVAKCTGERLDVVHSYEAHVGSVVQVVWDPERRWLFSCGVDKRIVAWNIGGKKGECYELSAHQGNLIGLALVNATQELLSLATDGLLVAWDLTVKRVQAADWRQSDTCELCGAPFYWNVKARLNTNRQHHCRRCGCAICKACVAVSKPYPIGGYETNGHICKSCSPLLTPEELASSVKVMDGLRSTRIVYIEALGLLLLPQKKTHTVLAMKYPES